MDLAQHVSRRAESFKQRLDCHSGSYKQQTLTNILPIDILIWNCNKAVTIIRVGRKGGDSCAIRDHVGHNLL